MNWLNPCKFIAHHLQSVLFPSTCVLCHSPTSRSFDICSACECDLPRLSSRCVICAAPLHVDTEQCCGACLHEPPPFDHTIALWQYDFPTNKLILDLKFHAKLVNARIISELFIKQLQRHYEKKNMPECIIPVPLHKKRLHERGFNQAIEIAKPIAKQCKIPLEITLCHRTRATQAQSSLPAKKRQQNIKGAFDLTRPCEYKHIAILDDVVTTGHTIREMCRGLKKAGVERIEVWCVART